MTPGVLYMDYFFYWHFLSCTVAQLVPYCWSMYFTQQTLCLPCSLLIPSTWYIGIYTVDTLLYSLHFTNYIILFLPQLSYYLQVFIWVLQPELFLKVITETVAFHDILALVYGPIQLIQKFISRIHLAFVLSRLHRELWNLTQRWVISSEYG